MGKKKSVKKKKVAVRAGENPQVKKPHHIPIDVYIQEAKNLTRWARQDQEALIAAGLDPGLIEDLPNRSDALSQAETQWFTEKNTRREAVKKWNLLSPQAYDLKKRIVEVFTYAFRKHPRLLKGVRSIRKKQKKVDLINGLSVLGYVGKKHPRILSGVGFDMSLLDQALEMGTELKQIISQAELSRLDYDKFKKERDQAYAHLKEAVDEIRACGRFVFRHNRERVRGYTSNHMRQQNARKALRAKNAAAKVAAEETQNQEIPSPGKK